MWEDGQSRKRSPSDRTDEPWAIVGPMLPPATQRPRGGRPRTVDMREVLHTLLSVHRSGGPWEMLPHAVLPKSTVYDDLAQWRDDGTWAGVVTAWRERHRVEAGREPTPSAAGIASPAVKTTAMGDPARGDDGGTNSNGRTRPLWGDTLGLWMAIVRTSAGVDAGVAALTVRGHVNPQDFPRLVTSFAEQPWHHHALEAWMAEPRAGWRIAVKTRPAGPKGFTPLETRGVMESTNAWHGRYRRNRQDDARSLESRTAMIQMRNSHLLLNRLAPCDRPAWHDRQEAA